MMEEDHFEPDFEVYYYILDDGRLARLWHDVDAGEYVDGEVMDEDGEWDECPVADIMAHGEEISYEEASKRALSFGGTV